MHALPRTPPPVSCLTRSPRCGLWEHKLPSRHFPVSASGIVGLFLISDCLLASWTFTPHVYGSVQSKIQGDSPELSFCAAPLLWYSGCFGSLGSHQSPLLSQTDSAGLSFGIPLPNPQPGSCLGSKLGWGLEQEWPPCLSPFCWECFPSDSPTLQYPASEDWFFFVSLIRFSSCLWQDSSLHSKVEVPGGF